MSSPKNIFVIRVDKDARSFLSDELDHGRLRQGWGPPGTALREGTKVIDRESWISGYVDASIRADWPKEDSVAIARRYRILSGMLKLETNDLVVIPKMPDEGCFTVARVCDGYTFDSHGNYLDYNHVIGIDDQRQFNYNGGINCRTIVKMFGGYRSAVNQVWNSVFAGALEDLLKSDEGTESKGVSTLFADIREPLVRHALEKICKLTPGDLEKLIETAFVNAGYKLEKRNYFDKCGGDADRVFSYDLPMVSGSLNKPFMIFVQAKSKTGGDLDDIEGVKQLAKISELTPDCLRILMSTVDEYSKKCQELAEAEGVMLITGPELAQVLLQYVPNT